MANEYADWRELKEDMRSVSSAETSLDAAFQRAIRRASRAIDRRCGRRFWRDGTASPRTYSPRGRTVLRNTEELLITDDIATDAGLSVSIGGVTVEISGISTYPETAIAKGDAITGLLRSSWYGGRIVVTAEWGWPSVPDGIEEATLLLANRRYMRKDSPEGVSGWSQEGQIQVSRFDPDIEDLVAPFVIEGFGT